VKSVEQFVSNKITYNSIVMQSFSEHCMLTSLLNCNRLILMNTFLLRSGASTEIFVSFLSFYAEENEGDLVNLKFVNFLTVERQFS
jgi:hypothetical protein